MAAVLVVEDDKLLGKAVSQTLEGAGYEVFWARDANEAFEALGAQEIKMVYLDLMLPGDKDGFEIIRKMRNEENYKSIPVIILSNLGQMKDIDRAMELGASDYLVKANIDLEKLVDMTKERVA